MLLGACIWVALQCRELWLKREAAAAIKRTGGGVVYGAPRGPKWLRKFVGDDFFAEILQADFGPKTTDADLEHLEGLSQLRWLSLSRTRYGTADSNPSGGWLSLRSCTLAARKSRTPDWSTSNVWLN